MRSGFLIFVAGAAFAQSLVVQTSGSTASLRGVWAVNEKVVWASGTRGTYLKTTDGGEHWTAATVPGAETLDFRDVQGVDENTTYLLSIGQGDPSRVYKTTDGGAHWTVLLQNHDAKGFFDEMAFWDATHGILVGDPVDGRLVVMSTEDGGATWQRRQMPTALPGEGVFAASGTGITVMGKSEVWIGTGGKDAARVYHSKDGGLTWTVAAAPVRADSAGAGIFSVAFSDPLHGVAVGGDYNKANDETGNIAVTDDGGATWSKPDGTPPKGYRSAVAYVADRKIWIAAGPSGADISTDGGRNWKQFDTGNTNALSFVSSRAGWAVGARGRIAAFHPE
jgi:photosystem II stability/assembly factor-like uncharacterized protein